MVQLLLDAGALLGESPVWNAAEARLVRHEDYEDILARIANGSLAPEDAVEVIWRGG